MVTEPTQETLRDRDSNLRDKLREILTHKCFVLYVTASTLRFIGGFSIGFWSPSFFQKKWPDHTTEFSILNAIVVIGVVLWLLQAFGVLGSLNAIHIGK